MQGSFLLLFVIAGFRGLEVGNDTPMYVSYFSRLDGLGSLSVSENRFEFAFRLYNCLIAQFFSDPHILLIISSLVYFGLLYKVFRKISVTPVYSVLMYVGLTMYYSSLTMLRQCIAIGLCAIAYLYLMEKKRVRFVLLVVLAGMFHTTAYLVLVMLLFSLIPYKKNTRFLYFAIGLICAAFFNVLVQVVVILVPKYAGYLSGENYYIAGKLGSVIKAGIYGSLYLIYNYLYRRYGEDTEKNKILYFTSLMGALVTLASVQGAILSRIASYFNIMFCVAIPNALSWLPDRKKKYIWGSMILGVLFLYNMIILFLRPEWTGILPYVFWS